MATEFEGSYNHELDVCLKYTSLGVNDLAEILWNFDNLYSKILAFSSPVHVYKEKHFKNFLDLSSINTGDSINFKMKEGWKPEFTTENSDLEVGVPELLGVPAILLYILLASIDNTVQIDNNTLDTKLEKIEIQLENNQIYNKILNTNKGKGIRAIQRQVSKTVENIVNNPEITYFEINNIEIPCNKIKKDEEEQRVTS